MKPSKRRKSNPWDNPLTPEHKAIRLAQKFFRKIPPTNFRREWAAPNRTCPGLRLPMQSLLSRGCGGAAENPVTRKGLAANLATLRKKRAALRDCA